MPVKVKERTLGKMAKLSLDYGETISLMDKCNSNLRIK
jgi:hypothetical protein